LSRTVGNGLDDTRGRDRATVEHAALHGLLAHRVAATLARARVLLCLLSTFPQSGDCDSPQHTRIRRQARNGNTNVVVNTDQLLLVRRELAGRTLEREQHGVGLGAQTDGGRTLLDGLEGVLDLVELALWGLGVSVGS
jgi:hypothetical protein